MWRLKAWSLVFTAFLLGAGWSGNEVAARTLIVAINDAPPYRIVTETTDEPVYSGIYVDVVREAARRAGIDLVFQVVPFKRALHLMESGQADLMLGPNRTEDRQQYMYYFGAALPSEPKVIYTGALDANVIEIEDLEQEQERCSKKLRHRGIWQQWRQFVDQRHFHLQEEERKKQPRVLRELNQEHSDHSSRRCPNQKQEERFGR